MPFIRYNYRVVQISGWKLALAGLLVAALLFAFFVLAAGIFVLVFPVAVIAGTIAYLFGGRTGAHSFQDRGFHDGVIEAEYREIESKQLEQDGQDRNNNERSGR